MSDPQFFGYGSLVNLATHDYASPAPARLTGWRRVWRRTDARSAAFLSVERHEATAIDGIVACVPGADWAALDLREAAYVRRDVTRCVAPTTGPVAVYEVEAWITSSAPCPILLSYLDVVVQGYLRVHGEAGVEAVFATTMGWDTPVTDDRAAPMYPRHQALSAQERALVDRMLAQYAP